MPKRPPAKGRGADVFLGKDDRTPVKARRTPKGQGADVFLGPGVTPKPKRPPILSPALMETALDRVRQTLSPVPGRIDRSHLIVMLWLRIALKEAGF